MTIPRRHRRASTIASPRVLWAIVLAATMLTFALGQAVAKAAPGIPSAAHGASRAQHMQGLLGTC